MKNYMKVKNLAMSILVSIIYVQVLVEGMTVAQKIVGISCIFLLTYIATSYVDRVMIEEEKKDVQNR